MPKSYGVKFGAEFHTLRNSFAVVEAAAFGPAFYHGKHKLEVEKI